MKNSYYFPHDYNARNDPKLEELFLKMGCEGRGIYWTLIEMLYENNGYLPYNKLDYYANALRTDSERIATILNDYGLFKNDDKQFWSESCLKRLTNINEKREKARQSSFKRWHKNANALGSECERNAIKESKGKESKVIKDILCDLNSLLGSTYQTTVPKTAKLIKARLKEGFTVEDFKTVHRIKFKEWGKDKEMAKFLRPITLYSEKFESYLNQQEVTEKESEAL